MAFFVGAGYASQTMGRTIPSVELGLEFGPTVLEVMSGGVQTQVYYHSFYHVGLLFGFQKWGSGYLGDLWAGFGIGAQRGEKGLISIDPNIDDPEPDQDAMYGLAFRVEARPLDSVYIGVSYVMGYGSAFLFGGMGESGLVTLGLRY